MSKFQEEYNIARQSFEDFILVIFFLIDDLYKKIVPDCIKQRRRIETTFSQMAEQLHAQRVLAKTFSGLSPCDC